MRILPLTTLIVCFSTSAFATDFDMLVFNNSDNQKQKISVQLADEKDNQGNAKVKIEVCTSEESCSTYGPMDASEMENIIQSNMSYSASRTVEVGGSGVAAGLLTLAIYSVWENARFPLTPRSFFLNWALKGGARLTAAFFAGAVAGGYLYTLTPRGQKVMQDGAIRDAIEEKVNDMNVNDIKVVDLEPEYFSALKRKMTVMLSQAN